MEFPSSQTNSANRQIARAAGTVMVAIVLGQLTGLLAKMLIASAFGTGEELDAFYAANRFSETLFLMVAGGALGSAFIPVFTTFLEKNDRPSAWNLASAIANLVLLVLTFLSIVAALFAPQVVHYILAPGFNAPQQMLTAALLRLLLPTSIIFGLSGLVMGILNANQIFLFPALAPSMYQLGLIAGVLLIVPRSGIYGIAIGAVIGALLHLLIQVPRLFRLPGRSYNITLGWHSKAVREVLLLMGPRLLGVAVVQLNFWLNTYLASLQPEGSLTGINLAFPLMIMPQAAIAQSIAIAALPTFSAQVARGRFDEMRSSLAASLRGVLFLAIPATVGLILLRYPLVSLLYQHGEFTSQSTELVAWALLWYAAGLIGHCVVEIVSRAFYALHDTRTPVIIGVAAMSLNLIFSLLFSAGFSRVGWAPHGGLALANSLATALEMLGLIYLMRRRLSGLHLRRLLLGVGQGLISAAIMGAYLWAWMVLGNNLPLYIMGLGGALTGALVYLLVLYLMQVPELRQSWLWLTRRFTV